MLSTIHRFVRDRRLPPGERATARILAGEPLPAALNWDATAVHVAHLQRRDEPYRSSPLGLLLARDDVPSRVKNSAVEETVLHSLTGSGHVTLELLTDVLGSDDVTTLTKVLLMGYAWRNILITNMATPGYREMLSERHEVVAEATAASGNRTAALALEVLQRCAVGSVQPFVLVDAVTVLEPVGDEVLEVFWTLLDDEEGTAHWTPPERYAALVERAELVLAR